MKITIALLFLGLIVLTVAEPDLGERQQPDKDEHYDALNDGDGDIQVQRRSMRTYLLCADHAGILSCPHGQLIRVHYANYGRTTGGHVCPHRSIRTTNCYSYYSSRVIRCACNNQQSCRLFADHRNFGDPCYGTYKYLEVKYTCS